MLRRPSLSRWNRWPLWAFALALLLKAAVPLLATAAAQVQGKALVEVCTVYGVATVALDDGNGRSDPSDHAPEHGADHCVLGGLLLGAALDAPTAAVRLHAPLRTGAPVSIDRSPAAPDACAAWVARLKHGPPSFV